MQNTIKQILLTTLSILMLTAFVGNAQAQPSSFDHPIPLDSLMLRESLNVSDNERYYSFIAGTGKTELLFEVKASGDNAGATFDLFDAKHRPLLSNVLVQSVNKGTEREQQTIRVEREQQMILRVKGIRYGSVGGQGVYRVRISAQ